MAGMDEITPYKPSVFYFRKALREADSIERAVVVGLIVCAELEQLKAWVRERGLIPPRWICCPEEAEDKGLECEDFTPPGTETPIDFEALSL